MCSVLCSSTGSVNKELTGTITRLGGFVPRGCFRFSFLFVSADGFAMITLLMVREQIQSKSLFGDLLVCFVLGLM